MTDDNEIVSLMRTMIEKDAAERPDGSCFGGHRDQRREIEIDVATGALEWLHLNASIAAVKTIETPDPPDVLATLTNGNKYGIEVTELVHGGTIAYIKEQRKLGDQQHYYTDWTDQLIEEAILGLVSSKNKQPERYGDAPVALVIACDQMMITPAQVEKISVVTSVFTHVLVHFSYDPSPSAKGQGTYPIVSLSIQP
jgi:hypothetical protein